jgi:hypothetical protein
LPHCQVLAEDIRRKREHFSYLDAPQLLKHALGLATQLGLRFDLLYLYFDWPGSESVKHQAEVARFSERVGTDLRFKSLTYQDLFLRLEIGERFRGANALRCKCRAARERLRALACSQWMVVR